MKKILLSFLLLNVAWAETSDELENKLDAYVQQLQDFRGNESNISAHYIGKDYFLCPGDMVEDEMRAAIFQAAKRPDAEFISPWNGKAKLIWEDGKEKPEYNILTIVNGVKQDGTQGIALEDVVIMPRGQMPKITEVAQDINDTDRVYRNLIATYPKNCMITVLNKSNLNWKQDTIHNIVALRQLKDNKAEFEWRKPKVDVENIGYEIFALDENGQLLELNEHVVIPLSVKNRLNKASTDIYPKSKAALKKQMAENVNKVWDEGEYHLLQANGQINNIFIKSYNELTETKASIALDTIKGKPAYQYLGENPLYSPNYYTLDDAKSKINIQKMGEDDYQVFMPISLNSVYAFIDDDNDELFWDASIKLMGDQLKNQTVKLHYPLEMKVDIFDADNQDIVFSEDKMTIMFSPKKLGIEALLKYYLTDNVIQLPYRLYDEKGGLLEPINITNRLGDCDSDANEICLITVSANEPIAWMETAFPKSYEPIILTKP